MFVCLLSLAGSFFLCIPFATLDKQVKINRILVRGLGSLRLVIERILVSFIWGTYNRGLEELYSEFYGTPLNVGTYATPGM